MRHNKLITRILVLFYLLSTFASATHIHQDFTESYTDCKVCVVSDSMHGGAVAEPLAMAVLPHTIVSLDFLALSYVSPISKGYDAHAPPHSFI